MFGILTGRQVGKVGQVYPGLIGFRRDGGVREKLVGRRGLVVDSEVGVVPEHPLFQGLHPVSERTNL